MESRDPKVWATVTILVSLIGCIGTIASAVLGASWIVQLLFTPTPTLGVTSLTETQTSMMTTTVPNQPQVPQSYTPTLSPISSSTIEVIPFTPTVPPPDQDNLIINGSFTNDFTGWERVLLDEGGHSETKIIPFQSGRYGHALSLYHTGPGGVYFRQVVEVPTTHLNFYVTFQSDVETSLFGSPTGIAEIALIYLDADDNELGRTHIVNIPAGIFTDVPCVGCPTSPRNSNTQKFIIVENGHLYVSYALDIYSHLTQELLGVPVDDVRKITFILGVSTTADSETSTLESKLVVTDLRLYPQQ